MFAIVLMAMAVVWLVPGAVAMVPGPTEEDDQPPTEATPALESFEIQAATAAMAPSGHDQGFHLPQTPSLGELQSLHAYATYPPRYYVQCLSIGLPNKGALRGAVLFPRENVFYSGFRAERQWATPETVDALIYAAARVDKKFGASHQLVLGDISYREGGKLRHHLSHQAGRDADIGFYFRNGSPGYLAPGMLSNLDIPRNWAYIEALIEIDAAELILLDYTIQELLYNYVKNRLRAPQSYLDQVFQYPRPRNHRVGLIRHSRGHKNHYHLRFFSPTAVSNALKARFTDPHLAQLQQLMFGRVAVHHAQARPRPAPSARQTSLPTRSYTTVPPHSKRLVHTVRSGESLWSIARRYGTTVNRIREWNNLGSSSRIRVGQKLVIYVKKSARSS